MTVTLLLKMLGGGLFLTSSSTIAVITTLHPDSVGSNFIQTIKDEDSINLYAHLIKPISPITSSTNFQCKLIFNPKENNTPEPFYCEIYKLDNKNTTSNNQYKVKDINQHFTEIYDIRDTENSLIRVKFDKKNFAETKISLHRWKIEISPYNKPDVVVEATPTLRFHKNTMDGYTQQFVVKSESTGTIVVISQTNICSVDGGGAEPCAIYVFNKSENPTDSSTSYQATDFDVQAIERGVKQSSSDIPSIKANHHYIIEFHGNPFSATYAEYLPKTITNSNSISGKPPTITFKVVKPAITANINNKSHLFVFDE